MATDAQIAANRLNAQKSTGPKTQAGKRRSRRNAIKHGLTAEICIAGFECAGEYRALENRIYADYAPRSAVEGALVIRLASLLWRLRRATVIERGLMEDAEQAKHDVNGALAAVDAPRIASDLPEQGPVEPDVRWRAAAYDNGSNAAHAFTRMIATESSAFDRLGRYEIRLWRQAAQTICVLRAIQGKTATTGDCGAGLNESRGAFRYGSVSDLFATRLP